MKKKLNVYQNYINILSANKKNGNNIVLLDIEVSLKSESEEYFQDRIDILLFNNLTNSLKFYEAKLYNNSQIRSRTTPEVILQIERYNNQLVSNKEKIIEQYCKYRNIVNNLFDLELNEAESLVENVTLIVTDFDSNQVNSPTLKHLGNVCGNHGPTINYYPIGNTSSIQIETLWNI